MFKVVLITVLVAVQVFGQDVDPIFASSDDKAKAELVERFGEEGTSTEAPLTFKYTPSDLKQFSGHALNFLQSKCPKVNSNTIVQLRKFIGKFIAKKNPKFSDNATFRAVLKSISTCASQVDVTDAPTFGENGPPMLEKFPVSTAELLAQDSSEEELKETKDQDKKEAGKIEVKPVIPTVEPTVPKPNFFQWAQNIVRTVAAFIQRIFGGEHRRDRRSADETTEVPVSTTPSNLGFFSFFIPSFFQAKPNPEVVNTEPKTESEISFAEFFSKVCRLYCQKCHNNKEFYPTEYMEAAAELRSLLFNTQGEIPADVKMVQSAIERYLTPEFMQTVMDCY